MLNTTQLWKEITSARLWKLKRQHIPWSIGEYLNNLCSHWARCKGNKSYSHVGVVTDVVLLPLVSRAAVLEGTPNVGCQRLRHLRNTHKRDNAISANTMAAILWTTFLWRQFCWSLFLGIQLPDSYLLLRAGGNGRNQWDRMLPMWRIGRSSLVQVLVEERRNSILSYANPSKSSWIIW